MALQIKWKRLKDSVQLPKKAHPSDACMDLRILVSSEEEFRPKSLTYGYQATITTSHDPDGLTETEATVINPNETMMFHTGLKCAIPEGHVLKVYVRSSTGIKQQLTLSNGTGIIDAHYRGELMVALTNNSNVPRLISDGDRLAQMELVPVLEYDNIEVDELDETDRGEGGFGSTGN